MASITIGNGGSVTVGNGGSIVMAEGGTPPPPAPDPRPFYAYWWDGSAWHSVADGGTIPAASVQLPPNLVCRQICISADDPSYSVDDGKQSFAGCAINTFWEAGVSGAPVPHNPAVLGGMSVNGITIVAEGGFSVTFDLSGTVVGGSYVAAWTFT